MNIEKRLMGGLALSNAATGQKIEGYAAVFNSEANIGGMFREIIRPGAFSNVLSRADVRALINHDENLVLGRNKANTLSLAEDDRGLKFDVTPPNTQYANDLKISMERGDVSECSFAFTMQGGIETWDETGDIPLRSIERVGDLFDVSVVTYPAYQDTSAALRSLSEFRELHSKNPNVAILTGVRLRMKHGLHARVAG
jgi:HK97 family phage prohead protease